MDAVKVGGWTDLTPLPRTIREWPVASLRTRSPLNMPCNFHRFEREALTVPGNCKVDLGSDRTMTRRLSNIHRCVKGSFFSSVSLVFPVMLLEE